MLHFVSRWALAIFQEQLVRVLTREWAVSICLGKTGTWALTQDTTVYHNNNYTYYFYCTQAILREATNQGGEGERSQKELE